jgi:hypothetical protein
LRTDLAAQELLEELADQRPVMLDSAGQFDFAVTYPMPSPSLFV